MGFLSKIGSAVESYCDKKEDEYLLLHYKTYKGYTYNILKQCIEDRRPDRKIKTEGQRLLALIVLSYGNVSVNNYCYVFDLFYREKDEKDYKRLLDRMKKIEDLKDPVEEFIKKYIEES